ncbi:methyltransferase [Labrys miyagiensis]|uniref:Methyltransferase n=1 Tax=Labrys miyagiensis TaxID=346912 RepID=A0ABQ6CT68_9HYPH|nr:methyltransferase [Labrys miyagiensis]GLS23521.1 methyltransferase [Labrys miyagiensis]
MDDTIELSSTKEPSSIPDSPASEAPPAHVQLIQMVTGHWVSSVIYAAAKLDLADHLAAGPRSAEELAGPLGAHAPSLHRFMRCLAGLGVLSERPGQRFALTDLGEALKTGAPGSARASILTIGSPWFGGAFDEIVYSIQTGKTGFEKTQGMPAFEYLSRHPEAASLFSETMVGVHGQEPPAVAEAYDFSAFHTVVDVGGATGNLLAAILARHQGPRGILFDRPYVVGDATALLEARGVADRVTIEAGDFFETVPAGADAYVLSHIIHDWNEAQCLAILARVRKAMKPEGRLLLVEMVLPAGDTPHFGKLLDMVMLVLPGGQERTEEEYRPLLAKAGFRLTRVIPTHSAVSIVEAVQA